MSDELIIIAKIESKKENIDFVKSEALKLIEPTRKENGCIHYSLQQDNEHPEIFIFVERWESKDLWQIHMKSNHLKSFIDAIDGFLNGLTINEMSRID